MTIRLAALFAATVFFLCSHVVLAAAPDVVTAADNPVSFGAAAAMSDDMLVVTAVRGGLADERNREAAVYVFVREGDGWREVQKLTVPGREEWVQWSAFGQNVALANDTVFVSAPDEDVEGIEDAGAVFVFERVAGEARWAFSARLTAASPGAPLHFGRALAVHEGTVMIGAQSPGGPSGPPSGAVFLFEHDAEQGQWRQRARFEAPPGYDVLFGQSLDVFGSVAVAPARNNGVVLIYERDAAGWYHTGELRLRHAQDWHDPPVEHAIVHGDTLLASLPYDPAIDAPEGTHGRVSISEFRAGAWKEVAQLSSPNADDPQFGHSIALHGNAMVITPQYRPAAHVYRRGDDGRWKHAGTASDAGLMESDIRVLDMTGTAFALRGNRAVLIYALDEFSPGDGTGNDDGAPVDEPAPPADEGDDVEEGGDPVATPGASAGTGNDTGAAGGGAVMWLWLALWLVGVVRRER